ncbi:TPA: hypothetical protein ACH3X2_006208, partial [Trebouxia sp. C0005]
MRYILIWPETKPNASSPIYLFCAQEVTLPEASPGAGFYSALANSTGALQIWPEHRYYANSAPYTPTDQFAHFTIEQALVDHVELVLYVQNMFNLTTNPVIAIGSSYSGQLSSYLRMRYPDVIAGAISSSPTSFAALDLAWPSCYIAPLLILGLAGVPAYASGLLVLIFISTTLSTTQLRVANGQCPGSLQCNTTTSYGCLERIRSYCENLRRKSWPS